MSTQPYPTAFDICCWLELQTWTFAKSMPKIPHEWTRKSQTDPEQMRCYERAVDFIRSEGTPEKYGRTTYRYLYHNGFKYWTMAPSSQSYIMNRARVFDIYDKVAPAYDGLFADPGSQFEDDRLGHELRCSGIDWRRDSILDVGCGTGLLITLVDPNPDNYTGLDPSGGMLEQAKAHHPRYADRLRQQSLEQFLPVAPGRYEAIVSTFGSLNYVLPHRLPLLTELLAPGGKLFLMFFKPDYEPEVEKRSHVPLFHFRHTLEELPKMFPVELNGKPLIFREWHNYIIVQTHE